jgi:hypothetical protein
MITSTVASAFPVPADLDGFWMFDQAHAPRPLTPLSQEILLSALTEGFCAALKEVGYPLGIRFRAVNHYAYCTLTPHDETARRPATPPSEHDNAIAGLIARLGERWESEWLPSILPALERLRTLDYGALSDDALLAALHDLRRDLVARWRIHGFLLFSYQAASTFDDFYTGMFHPADPMEPYLLLNGFETRSFEANRCLWRLSREVRRSSLPDGAWSTLALHQASWVGRIHAAARPLSRYWLIPGRRRCSTRGGLRCTATEHHRGMNIPMPPATGRRRTGAVLVAASAESSASLGAGCVLRTPHSDDSL